MVKLGDMSGDVAVAVPDDFKFLLTASVLAALAIGLVLEAISASRAHRRARRRSYITNIATFLFNDTVVGLLSLTTLLWIAQRYAQYGVFSAVTNPILKTIIAFVLLDFVLYIWHRACHSYDMLWLFHKVHHSDTVMNVTTSFRLHILEVVIVTFIKAVVVVASGLNALTVVGAEGLITLFVLFQHIDIRFQAERWLGWVITVPAQHRVHHSTRRREQNRNFGAALSVWDRLCGTLAVGYPEKLGIEGVREQGFFELLRFGVTPDKPWPNVRRFIPRIPVLETGR